jgi:hypothetical protein
MMAFNPSRWGTLGYLNENALDQVMKAVGIHVVRTICKDGRAVVNARVCCERNALAREVRGAEKNWDAYEVVCGMVERAVRTSDRCIITTRGDVRVIFAMVEEAFGFHVDCCAAIPRLKSYPNSYRHVMVFSSVVVLLATDDTGHITFVAHYELQFLYNVSKMAPDWYGELSNTMVQILDLCLQYANNPLATQSAFMSEFAMYIVPRKPAIELDYYQDVLPGQYCIPNPIYLIPNSFNCY